MAELKGWKPPKGTVPTLIHDIYGEGILVYFPEGDKEAPKRVENAIRQAQLNGGKRREKMKITPRHLEVLNLIAQGDEIILRVDPETVKELRLSGFVTRTYKQQAFVYTVTPQGYETLKKEAI